MSNEPLRNFTRQLFGTDEPLTPLEHVLHDSTEPAPKTEPDELPVAPVIHSQGKQATYQLTDAEVRTLSHTGNLDPTSTFLHNLFNNH